MKNLKFASGLISGIILGVFLVFLVTCKSGSPASGEKVPDSFTYVEGLNSYGGEVYKLTLDNIQYIVVKDNSHGGIAIIRHQ
jgi:hypothetical protein